MSFTETGAQFGCDQLMVSSDATNKPILVEKFQDFYWHQFFVTGDPSRPKVEISTFSKPNFILKGVSKMSKTKNS